MKVSNLYRSQLRNTDTLQGLMETVSSNLRSRGSVADSCPIVGTTYERAEPLYIKGENLRDYFLLKHK